MARFPQTKGDEEQQQQQFRQLREEVERAEKEQRKESSEPKEDKTSDKEKIREEERERKRLIAEARREARFEARKERAVKFEKFKAELPERVAKGAGRAVAGTGAFLKKEFQASLASGRAVARQRGPLNSPSVGARNILAPDVGRANTNVLMREPVDLFRGDQIGIREPQANILMLGVTPKETAMSPSLNLDSKAGDFFQIGGSRGGFGESMGMTSQFSKKSGKKRSQTSKKARMTFNQGMRRFI